MGFDSVFGPSLGSHNEEPPEDSRECDSEDCTDFMPCLACRGEDEEEEEDDE